mmetsp:Transcript_21172/g.38657  ORF Transcript_21172/g.38657 Transcript_21172/m.38657 type:complete len:317 (+) Transcript_21172:60-1010(+)
MEEEPEAGLQADMEESASLQEDIPVDESASVQEDIAGDDVQEDIAVDDSAGLQEDIRVDEEHSHQEELRGFVLKALETEGVLGHIRAQLRSSVYKVIDCDGEAQTLLPHGPLQSSGAACSLAKQQYLRSRAGRLLAEIVAECMEFYGLKHSVSVLMPESGLGAGKGREDRKLRDRKEIAADAGLETLTSGSSVLEQLVAYANGHDGHGQGVPVSGTATSVTTPSSSPSGRDSAVEVGEVLPPASPTHSEPVSTPASSVTSSVHDEPRPAPWRVHKLPPLTTGTTKEPVPLKSWRGALGAAKQPLRESKSGTSGSGV